MKALIRDDDVLTEMTGVRFIDWNTGYPLTSAKWFGGPYRLVENYVAPTEDQEASYDEIAAEPKPVVEENEDDYVVINGVRYSKDELRSLLE